MIDRDEIDKLAGEYVLGTLELHERQQVDELRKQDSALDAAITAWEACLVPLTEQVAEQPPPSHILAKIDMRLDQLTNPAATAVTTAKPDESAAIMHLRRNIRRWQWYSGLSSAAALVLLGLLWLAPEPVEQQQFVAVFQQNDQQPAFLLSVDLTQKSVHISPVTAERIPGKSYQLWIKANPLGPNPRSVAVLDGSLTVNPAVLRQYEPELLKQATFGISLEPEGGSPTGQPTGPAIHGYLYPATQPF